MPAATSPGTRDKPPTPASLLKRYGLKAKKGLGQHFLNDFSLARRIVQVSGLASGKTVVELGAGLGTLTLALAEKAARVIAFELDETLIQILEKEKFLPPNVELRRADILKLDYLALARELGQPFVLFGNLPYYLSSRLLYKLIEEREAFNWAVFMFQKEVAERLLAAPGTKDYGPLTVYLKLTAEVQRLMNLPPGCFYPAPEVHSTVVKITIKQRPPLPQEEALKKLLKIAFSSRRKKLVKNLTALGLKNEELKKILAALGLPENVRAEEIPPEKFLALAQHLGPLKAW